MTTMRESLTEVIRKSRAANSSASGTFALIGWVGTGDQVWIAPLGTPAPDSDFPIDPSWAPVRPGAEDLDLD